MKRSTIQEKRYKQQHERPYDAKIATTKKPQSSRRKSRRRHPSDESSTQEDSSDEYSDDSENAAAFKDWKSPNRSRQQGSLKPKDYSTSKRDKITQKNLISPTPSFLTPTVRKATLPGVKKKMPPMVPAEKIDKWSKNHLDSAHSKNSGDFESPQHRKHRGDTLKADKQKSRRVASVERKKTSRMTTALPCDVVPGPAGPQTSYVIVDGEPKTGNPQKGAENPEKKGKDPGESKVLKANSSKLGNVETTTTRASGSEKEIQVHSALVSKSPVETTGEGGKMAAGKPKEKLVYVVEEEGESPTKLETDLFTVNEIFTIKKDLLELSEFAKKLKRLKEMKKETDKGKKLGKPCQCEPASELLRDVNKRIEALEARQMELERGLSNKNFILDEKRQSGNASPPRTEGYYASSRVTSFPVAQDDGTGTHRSRMKTESEGKHDVMKTPSYLSSRVQETIPNSVIVNTTLASKAGVLSSKPDGTSKNSEIVHELMNIKSHLQKLESRRQAKDVPAKHLPAGPSVEPSKKKGHAIAVFSSKTYILTSPKKYGKDREDIEKCESSVSGDDVNLIGITEPRGHKTEDKNWKTKTEKTKENVANWLKTVPPRPSSGNGFAGLLQAKGNASIFKSKQRSSSAAPVRCKTCCKELSDEDFEYQGKQNNRALKTKRKRGDWFLRREKQLKKLEELKSQVECIDCILKSIDGATTDSLKTAKGSPEEMTVTASTNLPEQKGTVSTLLVLPRSTSVSSIPSAILNHEYAMRTQSKAYNSTHSCFVSSKSMHDMNKNEKTKRNTTTKQNEVRSHHKHDKRNKESKNEMVKKKQEEVSGELKEPTRVGPTASKSLLMHSINLNDSKLSNPGDVRNKIAKTFSVYTCATSESPTGQMTGPSCEGSGGSKYENIDKYESEFDNRNNNNNNDEEDEEVEDEDEDDDDDEDEDDEDNDEEYENEENKSRERILKPGFINVNGKLICTICNKEKRGWRGNHEGIFGNERGFFRHIPIHAFYGATCHKKQSGYHFKVFRNSVKNKCTCFKKCRRPSKKVKKKTSKTFKCVAVEPLEVPTNEKICETKPEKKPDEGRRRREWTYCGESSQRRKTWETKAGYSGVSMRNSEQSTKDSCGLTSFMKNLRSIYPRCSYLNLLKCEKKKKCKDTQVEEVKCEPIEGKIVIKRKKSKNKVCPIRKTCRKVCRSPSDECVKKYKCLDKLDGLKNCKCIELSIEDEQCQRKKHYNRAETVTDSSEVSSMSVRNHEPKIVKEGRAMPRLLKNCNFTFPYRQSPIYYIERAEQCEDEDDDDDDDGCGKKRKKRKKKKKDDCCESSDRSTECDENQRPDESSREDLSPKDSCICPICKNVHRPNQKPCEPKRSKENISSNEDRCRDPGTPEKEPGYNFFYSLLSKLSSKKSSSKNPLRKICELRNMKVCKGKTLKQSLREKKLNYERYVRARRAREKALKLEEACRRCHQVTIKEPSEGSHSKCQIQLNKILEALQEYEKCDKRCRKPSESEGSEDSCCRKKKKKKKKKRKQSCEEKCLKKCNKKKKCSDSSKSEDDKCKKKKKKKKKKCKCCSDSECEIEKCKKKKKKRKCCSDSECDKCKKKKKKKKKKRKCCSASDCEECEPKKDKCKKKKRKCKKKPECESESEKTRKPDPCDTYFCTCYSLESRDSTLTGDKASKELLETGLACET